MLDETVPMMTLARKTDDAEFQLSSREQILIRNLRAMKSSAGDMLVDLSEQYVRTLPAKPVKLRLLRTRD